MKHLVELFMVGAAMALLFVPGPSNALVIYPGQYVEQVPAESGSVSKFVGGIGRLNSGHVPHINIARAEASVDVANNKINLSAFANSCDSPVDFYTLCIPGSYRAAATGRLFVDICVPLDGKTTCDPGDEGPAVNATIAFDVARVGYIITFAPAAKASMDVTAGVYDTSYTPERSVGFQDIATEAQGSLIGTVKPIKFVPVPIPELGSSNTTTRRQFVVVLRTGHNYRFQLRANVTATGGFGAANVNFRDALVGLPTFNGYFELYNLAIDVAPDASGGIDPTLIQNLQQRLAEMSDRVNAILSQLLDDGTQHALQLENLAMEFDQLGQQVMVLSRKIDELNQNLSSSGNSLQRLNRRLNKLNHQVSDLKDRVEGRNRRHDEHREHEHDDHED